MEELKNILKEIFNKNHIRFYAMSYKDNIMISFDCLIYVKKIIYDLCILNSNDNIVDLDNILIDLSYLKQSYPKNKFTKSKNVLLKVHIKNIRMFLDEFNIDYNNISMLLINNYKSNLLGTIEYCQKCIKVIDDNLKDMHIEFE